MWFNQRGDISTLNSSSLKWVDKFINRDRHQHANSKSMGSYDRLSVIWKSDLIDKIKSSFFQAAVVSILLYGCTTWTLTKRMEKKPDGNYTKMLRKILSKFWRQHLRKQQQYGHQPPITKTIQVRRTRHAEHCWRSKDELISDIILWTPLHGRAQAGQPVRTYIQHLCADTGCSLENLLGAMDVRDGCRERVRKICAGGATRWWHDDDHTNVKNSVSSNIYPEHEEKYLDSCLSWWY